MGASANASLKPHLPEFCRKKSCNVKRLDFQFLSKAGFATDLRSESRTFCSQIKRLTEVTFAKRKSTACCIQTPGRQICPRKFSVCSPWNYGIAGLPERTTCAADELKSGSTG